MALFDSIRREFSNKPEWKGLRFEEYVNDLFDETDFAISERTHSHRTNEERYVESSLNPDFVFRHKRSNDLVAVECKYRSNLYQGKLSWCNPSQLKRYRDFAKERKIPVYAIIGMGTDDSLPDELFVIPLEEAKYPALYPSVFQKYSRNPKMKLTWRNNELVSTSNPVYDWI